MSLTMVFKLFGSLVQTLNNTAQFAHGLMVMGIFCVNLCNFIFFFNSNKNIYVIFFFFFLIANSIIAL